MKNIIRLFRVTYDITQQALADKVGVSANSIRSWENRFTYPTVKQLKVMAEALHVAPEELLKHWEEIK